MKKHKGTTRTVFIFKNIVIKVARIYWKSAWTLFIFNLKHFNRKKSNKKDQEGWRLKKEKELEVKVLPYKKYEMDCTVSAAVLSGVMANLQERRFYLKTKNLFVMPTYFSFFGLFNIQKRGEKIDFWERDEIWQYISHNSQTENQAYCDCHTLSSLENFCLDNGRLKLVDYGSRRIWYYLELNGENLYNNFKHP